MSYDQHRCYRITLTHQPTALARVITTIGARGAEVLAVHLDAQTPENGRNLHVVTNGGGPNLRLQIGRLVEVLDIVEDDIGCTADTAVEAPVQGTDAEAQPGFD